LREGGRKEKERRNERRGEISEEGMRTERRGVI